MYGWRRKTMTNTTNGTNRERRAADAQITNINQAGRMRVRTGVKAGAMPGCNHNETQVRNRNSGLRDANGEKAVNPSVRR
jgi:hypothetical protein